MAQQLNVDEMVEAACKATGLERFDSESFREGLGVLAEDVNHSDRSDEQVAMFRNDMITALSTRLKVHAYLEGRPELLERPIKRPVFVFGIPRTGTTLLNNLLAADPARRSPLTWEIDDPVPPAASATLLSDPRAVARLDQHRQLLAAHPEAGKYYRGSPVYPNECIFIMAHDFKALMWELRGKLPLYAEWMFNTDFTSAYDYHKRFLQLLQADAPGTWNLKMPSHILFIETLLKTYPDARLIWTHRDPFTATGSLCSLIRLGHGRFAREIDHAYLGEHYSWQAAEHARRGMAARDRLGEDRVIDVHYSELTRKPIETMRALYAALGDDFTPEAEAGMQSWIDDNPQNKFGRHEYKLDQFGLSVEKLTPMFEDYLSRYDIEREG